MYGKDISVSEIILFCLSHIGQSDHLQVSYIFSCLRNHLEHYLMISTSVAGKKLT